MLGYLLPIFGTTNDIYNSNSISFHSHLIDNQIIQKTKADVSKLFEEESLAFDDEDNSNSNSIANVKDSATSMVIPKIVISSSINSETTNNQLTNNNDNNINKNTNNNENNNFINSNSNSAINIGSKHHQIVNSTLKLDDLKFRPICDIVVKEAISAVYRAKTQNCKEIIVNITCAIQNGTFYPKKLLSYCPHETFVENKPLGCFKDDKKFRTLSGYYINFLTTNTPKRCLQLCLQSGFVYAGVQYSFV